MKVRLRKCIYQSYTAVVSSVYYFLFYLATFVEMVVFGYVIKAHRKPVFKLAG
jgi:hypothetical protein